MEGIEKSGVVDGGPLFPIRRHRKAVLPTARGEALAGEEHRSTATSESTLFAKRRPSVHWDGERTSSERPFYSLQEEPSPGHSWRASAKFWDLDKLDIGRGHGFRNVALGKLARQQGRGGARRGYDGPRGSSLCRTLQVLAPESEATSSFRRPLRALRHDNNQSARTPKPPPPRRGLWTTTCSQVCLVGKTVEHSPRLCSQPIRSRSTNRRMLSFKAQGYNSVGKAKHTARC